jgi:hypothetical protein
VPVERRRLAFAAQARDARPLAADRELLEAKWVPGAHTVNVGQADVANRRLKQFARFGVGEPIGHWGGRYIWQLADSDELLVAWHPISWQEVAREYEKRLLARLGELDDGRRAVREPDQLTGQRGVSAGVLRPPAYGARQRAGPAVSGGGLDDR